jgi:hypothetical protein
MNMKKLLTTITIFAFALVASKLTFGQTPTSKPDAKRQWYHIQENMLKAGVSGAEYAEFRAKERVPALKKAGYKHQEFWVPAAVGKGAAMYTIEVWDDLSAFDQPNRLTKALGEEGARALGKKTSQYLADGRSHAWLALSDPEISWTEQMISPAKLAIVARVKIARGRSADFRNYIKNDYLPVVKKSGARGYQVLAVRYGGDADEYITLTFFDSFNELEKNDPSLAATQTRVAGEATAQKNVLKTIGIILHLERIILRFRPDLSILP